MATRRRQVRWARSRRSRSSSATPACRRSGTRTSPSRTPTMRWRRPRSSAAPSTPTPFDVMEAGRMGGHPGPPGRLLPGLAAQAAPRRAGSSTRPGALSWNELGTPDLDASAEFYGDLFGWTTIADGGRRCTYLVISNGDRHANGGDPRHRCRRARRRSGSSTSRPTTSTPRWPRSRSWAAACSLRRMDIGIATDRGRPGPAGRGVRAVRRATSTTDAGRPTRPRRAILGGCDVRRPMTAWPCWRRAGRVGCAAAGRRPSRRRARLAAVRRPPGRRGAARPSRRRSSPWPARRRAGRPAGPGRRPVGGRRRRQRRTGLERRSRSRVDRPEVRQELAASGMTARPQPGDADARRTGDRPDRRPGRRAGGDRRRQRDRPAALPLRRRPHDLRGHRLRLLGLDQLRVRRRAPARPHRGLGPARALGRPGARASGSRSSPTPATRSCTSPGCASTPSRWPRPGRDGRTGRPTSRT